jgi:hypothetical protein
MRSTRDPTPMDRTALDAIVKRWRMTGRDKSGAERLGDSAA